MDNDHGITGELRRFITDPLLGYASQSQHIERLTAIADRIDAAHEQAMAAAALIAGVPMTDENMAEHGWVKLPKDADGEYIHIGDMMENGERVARIVLTDGSWDPSVYTAKTPNQLREYFCHEISHYQPPTVEDVLHELVDEWVMASSTEDEEAAIAECAKKLQLRGDEQ